METAPNKMGSTTFRPTKGREKYSEEYNRGKR
jgi:hypothetical protein